MAYHCCVKAPYSTNVERDYGLLALGSRLNYTCTSPTHGIKTGIWISLKARLRGYDAQQVKTAMPTIVFQEKNDIGSCWKFAGPKGQIGVTLAQPVFVHKLTLHRPHFRLLPDKLLSMAPRKVVLWGVLDITPSQNITNVVSGKFGVNWPLLQMADIMYRLDTLVPSTQSFPVSHQFRTLPFRTLVIEVLDNYGSDVTCLYRVSVQGEDYKELIL